MTGKVCTLRPSAPLCYCAILVGFPSRLKAIVRMVAYQMWYVNRYSDNK